MNSRAADSKSCFTSHKQRLLDRVFGSDPSRRNCRRDSTPVDGGAVEELGASHGEAHEEDKATSIVASVITFNSVAKHIFGVLVSKGRVLS
jgi:hypothetical protein